MLKNIRFTCQLFEEGDQVVSTCPEFNVSSFGDTPEEAVASLHEAVSLFLEECDRMDTLKEVLETNVLTIPLSETKPLLTPGQQGLIALVSLMMRCWRETR